MEPPNTDFTGPGNLLYSRPAPTVVKWMIKYSGGLIQDEKIACYILFVVVFLVMLFSGMRIFHALQGPPKPTIMSATERNQQLGLKN